MSLQEIQSTSSSANNPSKPKATKKFMSRLGNTSQTNFGRIHAGYQIRWW